MPLVEVAAAMETETQLAASFRAVVEITTNLVAQLQHPTLDFRVVMAQQTAPAAVLAAVLVRRLLEVLAQDQSAVLAVRVFRLALFRAVQKLQLSAAAAAAHVAAVAVVQVQTVAAQVPQQVTALARLAQLIKAAAAAVVMVQVLAVQVRQVCVI
jgi:hypothetical protein